MDRFGNSSFPRSLRILAQAVAVAFALVSATPAAADETGLASWYGTRFQGRLTASGEVYDMNKLTAAHKTLPFGTRVRVTNLETGRSVVVVINDRGPFVQGRIIDLSRAAAQAIGLSGVSQVTLHIMGTAEMPAAEGRAATPMLLPPPRPEQSGFGQADAQSTAVVTVQVAAFKTAENVDRAIAQLQQGGLHPSIERSGDITRVLLRLVAVGDLPALRARLASLGFPSVLVRHDP